jgi:hypothetical protein
MKAHLPQWIEEGRLHGCSSGMSNLLERIVRVEEELKAQREMMLLAFSNGKAF